MIRTIVVFLLALMLAGPAMADEWKTLGDYYDPLDAVRLRNELERTRAYQEQLRLERERYRERQGPNYAFPPPPLAPYTVVPGVDPDMPLFCDTDRNGRTVCH